MANFVFFCSFLRFIAKNMNSLRRKKTRQVKRRSKTLPDSDYHIGVITFAKGGIPDTVLIQRHDIRT